MIKKGNNEIIPKFRIKFRKSLIFNKRIRKGAVELLILGTAAIVTERRALQEKLIGFQKFRSIIFLYSSHIHLAASIKYFSGNNSRLRDSLLLKFKTQKKYFGLLKLMLAAGEAIAEHKAGERKKKHKTSIM